MKMIQSYNENAIEIV